MAGLVDPKQEANEPVNVSRRNVIKAGADGIAVVSAILASDRPREAAAELRAAVDRALLRRSET